MRETVQRVFVVKKYEDKNVEFFSRMQYRKLFDSGRKL